MLTPGWRNAFAEARSAFARGLVVAIVGERGAGETAPGLAGLPGTAPRATPQGPPGPQETDAWLDLWPPELGKDRTCVIVSGADRLPAWVTAEPATMFARVRSGDDLQPYVITAESDADIPEEVQALIDTVVEVPALRYRRTTSCRWPGRSPSWTGVGKSPPARPRPVR